MENAFNGHALKPEQAEKIHATAKRHGLAVHLGRRPHFQRGVPRFAAT
ncbi:MAG: hypothetical protein M0C28_18655 [Candidatus Moduliflexus flocculans]|nr:hypothetical protein [Candidatus Moduliflexus flocculans]